MENFAIALLILATLTAMLVTVFAIPVTIRVARAKDLVDEPDKTRKLHTKSIPNLGGVAIFAGLLIGYSTWIGDVVPPYFPYLVTALVILFAVGIKDDIMVISPRKKTLAQIGASAILVIGGNVRLLHFDGFLGIHDGVPEVLAVVATIFAFMIIINAYNLVDGIDGLAASMGIVSALLFGTWFFVNGYMADAILAGAFVGALSGFLLYNKHPASIFMGDTGSLTIGLIMAMMAFRLIGLNPEATVMQLDTPTVFAFSLMIVPMFDTFRIIIVRVLNKKSPMAADKRHLHHCLMNFGFGHRGICRVLVISSLAIAAVSYSINHIDIHLYGFLVVAMGALIAPVAWLGKRIVRKLRAPKTCALINSDAVEVLLHSCMHGLENGAKLENGAESENGAELEESAETDKRRACAPEQIEVLEYQKD